MRAVPPGTFLAVALVYFGFKRIVPRRFYVWLWVVFVAITIALGVFIFAGCSAPPEADEQAQRAVQSTALCYPTDPPPVTQVDFTCLHNWTRDGRECMVCTHYNSCEFINPESGYCVDRALGCADPACVYGVPQ